MKKPTKQRETAEIVAMVKSGTKAVAWVTTKGAIVYISMYPVACIAGVDAAFFDDPTFPEPVFVVSGVRGLSSVDPEWDGTHLFKCGNPNCGEVHNTDWLAHDNLWARHGDGGEGNAP